MCAFTNFDMAVRKLRAIFNPQLQQHVCPYGEQNDFFLFLSFQVIFKFASQFFFFSYVMTGLRFLLERREIINRLFNEADAKMLYLAPPQKITYTRLWVGMCFILMWLWVLAHDLGIYYAYHIPHHPEAASWIKHGKGLIEGKPRGNAMRE